MSNPDTHVRAELLAVARGDAPASLLLKNARIVNVFTGQVETGDIALHRDRIAGIGSYDAADETIDLAGAYVAPGLIDAHVHIESSLCTPPHFATAVVPRGVTTVVTDPHEIANVAGVEGIRFMAAASRGLPLRVVIMAPSCVPATNLATSGATIEAGALARLLADGTVHGLAEVMNFPGVIFGDADVSAKLDAFSSRAIDGHAPGVRDKQLNAYVAAGVGSDHECVTVEEAREKLARGLYILIREATNAHNLDALLPLITPANSRRICFCTDDRQPADLLDIGGVDEMIRVAISRGVDPVVAFQLATLNPAEWFGLHDRGAITPGRFADLMIFEDLKSPRAKTVIAGGQIVAQDGGMLTTPGTDRVASDLSSVASACRVDLSTIDLRIPTTGPSKIRVIGSRPEQLITDALIADAHVVDAFIESDPSRDILKMAVIERHHGSNRVGLGFIKGFGLKRGALAGTVAHDHHNLVVIGCDDASMRAAARAVIDMRGGIAVSDGETLHATLPLPVAGLMSDRPIAKVRAGYDALLSAAKALGATMHDPFMAMSFMALEVIPALKLTDQGLVDVERFERVELVVG